MSLSFNIASKAKAKVAVNVKEQEEHRELITGVAGSKIQTAETDDGANKARMIPKLENTYRTGRGKFVPTFVPEAQSITELGKLDERFEAATKPTGPLITSYGLEVRGKGDTEAAAAAAAAAAGGEGAAPGSQQQPAQDSHKPPAAAAGAAGKPPAAPPAGSGSTVHAAKAARGDPASLKDELETLPEENDLERYEALPVEEFGLALLRGMGWKEGEGVGRKRQVVEAKMAVRRPERLGLGANPAAPVAPERPRPRKMGDPVAPVEDLVVAPDADGRQRHRAGASDKLVSRASLLPGPRPGKTMRVTAGRHQGLLGTVLEMLPVQEGRSAYARVRLHPSEEVVEVRCSELEDRQPPAAGPTAAAAAAAAAGPTGRGNHHQNGGTSSSRGREEHNGREDGRHREQERSSSGKRPGAVETADGRPPDKRHRGDEDGQRQGSRGHEKDRHTDGGHHHHHNGKQRDSSSKQQPAKQEPLWVAPLIRVRLLDKKVSGGALYLKKAVVLDVHPGGVCDLRVEGSGQLVTLPQRQLETVVPKEAGGSVLVVAGKHRGRRGRVLQSSTSKGAVAVQLSGDMLVVQLVLDDVAQYMGSLEDDDDM